MALGNSVNAITQAWSAPGRRWLPWLRARAAAVSQPQRCSASELRIGATEAPPAYVQGIPCIHVVPQLKRVTCGLPWDYAESVSLPPAGVASTVSHSICAHRGLAVPSMVDAWKQQCAPEFTAQLTLSS